MATPERLFDAVKNGNIAEVETLLRNDSTLANVVDDEGATALHYAARNGADEIVAILVRHGADINARDARFNATPTGWAIEYLRELGGALAIEVDFLAAAAQAGDVLWADAMLSKLPFLARVKDRHGKTPLDYALTSPNPKMIDLFHRHGIA